jgi:quinol monooxygenase YgiN
MIPKAMLSSFAKVVSGHRISDDGNQADLYLTPGGLKQPEHRPSEVLMVRQGPAVCEALEIWCVVRPKETAMWAQLITTRVKPGKDQDLPKLFEQLKATEQPGSGLLRSTAYRDQKDPTRMYMLVIFESEEKARAREHDERRQEGLAEVRATMADLFDGAPEFVDLTVANDFVP